MFFFFLSVIMSIIIKPSQKFGGDGGTTLNDLGFIAKSAIKIKTIDVNKIDAKCGDVVDFLQFTYNVVPIDGLPYNYPGSSYGGAGGAIKDYTFANGEQMIGINGRYGNYVDKVVIKFIEFHTSLSNYSCGTDV